jgi:hypothetical protein
MTVSTSEIDQAIAAHAQWKQRLEDAIEFGLFGTPVEVAAADDLCVLGKWLKQLDEDSEHARAVRRLHARFHKTVAAVAHFAISGKGAEARAMMSSGGEFSRMSQRLVSALAAWKFALEHGAEAPLSP